MDTIHILVSIDKNYCKPLKTMLYSLRHNNDGETFCIWLLHSRVPAEELENLSAFCREQKLEFVPVTVSDNHFRHAPANKRYPQEMYYRLLAPQLLPAAVSKVLYLDPDILVINPLRALWDLDLGERTFAAASHTGILDMAHSINKVRLSTTYPYYNTGVILIDLNKARILVDPDEIFRCVADHEIELIFPDQDIFNYLYGGHILEVSDAIWNYDARKYNDYFLTSSGNIDLDWVMANTSILHYCGAAKPWQKNYRYRTGILYKHYQAKVERLR